MTKRTRPVVLAAAVMACGSGCLLAQAGGSTTPPAPATQPTAATQPASVPPAAAPSMLSPPFTSPLLALPGTATTGPEGATSLPTVHVSSHLDEARDYIAPSLGARTYLIGPEQIQALPGGEHASFQQVLLRAPGVVEDSFGQVHVRGEHGNLTYRVNGTLLPEPLSGFGQELDTRLIKSVTLIDGTLPAQFGFHTAGIVDVTTKTGADLKHNELSLYGGSNDTINPAFQFGGSKDQFDFFVTGSFNHNDLGIENPTSTHHALHDYTDQEKFFGYFSYQIDDSSRLSLLMNASYADFQIPNTAGLTPQFTLAGSTFSNSAQLNENQNEQEYYTVLAYQKVVGDFSFQLSTFSRYGQIHFTPDTPGDLVFQGVAGNVLNNFVTNGAEFDSAYVLNERHTLRAGLIADATTEQLNTNTQVFTVDPVTGNPATTPTAIVDNSGNRALEAGIYLQDEWHLLPELTLNYGLRYDRFDSNFDEEGQLSPRANLVWTINDKTTAHFGYARYFTPPPVQAVRLASISNFANTTNAPDNFVADAPKVERSNYFDAGVSRQISKPWSLSLDGFYKQASQLIDEGQFGAPVIESPFNYRTGKVYGTELSSTYKEGGLSLFTNGSFVMTRAHDIDTQQYLIGADELAYIKNHDISLDHESEFTVSTGASYQWKHDFVYLDLLYENGLRKDFANSRKMPQYYPINAGYVHTFPLQGRQAMKLRFDIINVFDQTYEIRDGSGIGVGAPQFGARRGFYVGLSYEF